MPSKTTHTVPTRFLLLGDTHGMRCLPDTQALQPIDVVIHCGDITGDSRLAEYQGALDLLRAIDAPLKLLIPGNHDFTLDTPTFQQMCHKAKRRGRGISSSTLQQYYGAPGEAKHLLQEAGKDGILYLEEGTHRLALPNGALLTVFASPYTPAYGSPGFQYTAKQGHDFAIQEDVDVVVTHGPPRGVLDRSWMTGQHAGSVELYAAVARARPRLHCFGHIHEGWGAELVTWREGSKKNSSTVLANLGSILPLKGDTEGMVEEKERRLGEYARGKCVKTSHCAGDVLPVEPGENTLFVNAAVLGAPMRPPWVVDIELPAVEASDGSAGCGGGYTLAAERS